MGAALARLKNKALWALVCFFCWWGFTNLSELKADSAVNKSEHSGFAQRLTEIRDDVKAIRARLEGSRISDSRK